MCKSVKGAAYFGSSIHIVAAFVFLLWFLFDTVISEVHINLWRCAPQNDDSPRKYNILVHYLNLPFKLLYYFCLCVTGIYIFRGVERNNPRVIKFALLVFVIIQIIGMALFITISMNYWEDEGASESPHFPVADRLVSPQKSPENPDISYESYVYGDSGEDNGSYSVGIEVISHPPDIPQGVDFITQKEADLAEDASKTYTSESEPENLVLGQFPQENKSIILSHLQKSSSDNNYLGQIRQSGEDFITGREKFPLHIKSESMVLDPEEKGINEEAPSPTEEDIIPVLESPLDNFISTTPTSMSTEEVVFVKVLKGGDPPPKKMSHNQLVSVVFQVFLVGFNAIGTFIYTGVLILHLTSL